MHEKIAELDKKSCVLMATEDVAANLMRCGTALLIAAGTTLNAAIFRDLVFTPFIILASEKLEVAP